MTAYWTDNDLPMGSSGGGAISRLSTPSQMRTPTTATSAATTALAAPPAHRARTFTMRLGPDDGGAGVPMAALRCSQIRLTADLQPDQQRASAVTTGTVVTGRSAQTALAFSVGLLPMPG